MLDYTLKELLKDIKISLEKQQDLNEDFSELVGLLNDKMNLLYDKLQDLEKRLVILENFRKGK